MSKYSAEEVTVILGGIEVTDFEEVEIDQDEDTYSQQAGSSGENTHIKNSNKNGFIRVDIDQTREVNAQLSALLKTDTVFPVIVRDNNSLTDLHEITKARFKRQPGDTKNKSSVSNLSWNCIGRLDAHFSGGNQD